MPKSSAKSTAATRHSRGPSKKTQPSISNSSIRRLGYRAGLKRVRKHIYKESTDIMYALLEACIKDAMLYAQSAGRVTISQKDVVRAINNNGGTIYN